MMLDIWERKAYGCLQNPNTDSNNQNSNTDLALRTVLDEKKIGWEGKKVLVHSKLTLNQKLQVGNRSPKI